MVADHADTNKKLFLGSSESYMNPERANEDTFIVKPHNILPGQPIFLEQN